MTVWGRGRLAAALVLAVAAGAEPAAAQGLTRDENWKRCADSNPDLSIGGCTAVIQAGGETNANLAIAFTNRGRSYRRKGEYSRAIQDYDQAIRLNSSHAEAFDARGASLIEIGQHARAERDISESIRLDPKNAWAWGRRCLVRALLRQLDAALNDCEEGLRLQPSAYIPRINRAIVHFNAGRFEAAIADYDALLARDSKDGYSLYGRGVARQRKGDTAGGAADIAAAKTIQADVAAQMAKYGVQ